MASKTQPLVLVVLFLFALLSAEALPRKLGNASDLHLSSLEGRILANRAPVNRCLVEEGHPPKDAPRCHNY